MEAEPELFRAIVESTTDGIWVFDQRGRTTYANARMARLLGRTPEEMASLTLFDVLDRSGQEQMREYLTALERGVTGEDNLECSLLRKDGSRFWALVSLSLLRDRAGEPIGRLHRVTEDTDRKLLLDRLQAGEQRLAQAQAIAKVGSWDWDVVADKVTWSDELYRIFGLLPREFEPSYDGFLALVHPGDRHLVEDAVGSVFTGADEFEWQARVTRRDGGHVRVRGRGAVRRDDQGVPVWMSGTVQDLTEAYLAEEGLSSSTTR